ncbi:MAG: hypothetical protein JOY90_20265 [Bradyrhizobium sp.]|uniref:hypothetical protein n=1 Tax=Bradyrhizobium sp. TaxID=376 RepID=UPI001DB4DA63|nr:hypothetical protein [Bradyrhizobium sp.]MBV9562750.1 hypothetical protein [Bradyrhizobium sp.]
MKRKLIFTAMLLLAAITAYVGWPRRPDLRAFDPAAMAHLETAMWRDYYEKHYPALFYHLAESSRTEFGFSPLQSIRIALAAARAAKTFQPTHSRHEAEAAIPDLVTYYDLLRPAAPVSFDVREVAGRELDWWQARRESVGPQTYGVTVAAVAALTYGRQEADPDIMAFGIERAEAMAFRDARSAAITEQDWSAIETRLHGAYQRLKTAIAKQP